MQSGDKIKWRDLISGRTRYGVLGEPYTTVAESQPIDDLSEKLKFKRVYRKGWEVKEDRTGHVFALRVGMFEVIKPN